MEHKLGTPAGSNLLDCDQFVISAANCEKNEGARFRPIGARVRLPFVPKHLYPSPPSARGGRTHTAVGRTRAVHPLLREGCVTAHL